MTIFINRKSELKALQDWSKKEKTALITGRRRIGKSRLILEFIKHKKAVYLLAADKGKEYNLRKFSEQISREFNVPGLRFNDFEEMFEFFEETKLEIIVIDEFGYLIKAGVLGEFQRIIDSKLKTKKLILSGSFVSLIESRLLGYKSVLYGRIDLIKRILPLKFSHLFEWFPDLNMEDAVKLYSVSSGIPRYLEFFNAKNTEKEIKEKMFNPDILLFRDTKLLLAEELPEPTRFLLILESISFGKNKVSEISDYTKIKVNQLPYYLNVLKNLRLIKHEKPLFEKKRGVYCIADNYMTFWFKFISPFFEEIESGIKENAINKFEQNFNSFQGKVFEDICKEFLIENKLFYFTKIARWWHKSNEIDFVCVNEKTKQILFAECKWKNKVNAKKIVTELKQKSHNLKWQNKKRKESYTVFAKSFSKKIQEFEGKPVKCYDLKDLEKTLKKKQTKTFSNASLL